MILIVQAIRRRENRRAIAAHRMRPFRPNTTYRYRYVRRGDWHIVLGHPIPQPNHRNWPSKTHHVAMRLLSAMAWLDMLTLPLFMQRVIEPQLAEIFTVIRALLAALRIGL